MIDIKLGALAALPRVIAAYVGAVNFYRSFQ